MESDVPKNALLEINGHAQYSRLDIKPASLKENQVNATVFMNLTVGLIFRRVGCLLLILGVHAFFFKAVAQNDKSSKVKIYAPQSDNQRADLIGLLEIDHFYFEGEGIITELNEAQMEKLKTSGVRYQVLVADMAAWLRKENAKYYADLQKAISPDHIHSRYALTEQCKTIGNIIQTPPSFEVRVTFGGYYSYAQMVTQIDSLVLMYPTLAQKINIGTSVQGRIIWAIKISDNVALDEDEPEVLYLGLQHAREAIGGSSMIFWMQYLCDFYAGNTTVKDLVDNREIYIVPCVNPDGWEYNRTTGGGVGATWRKNRRNNGGGSYGVDLNRNYGVDWADCSGATGGTACGSGTSTSDTYYGTAAFSEPETQAIRNLTISRRFVAMIDQHSYGPYYSLPFGRRSLHTMSAPDKLYYTHIPAAMGLYNGMRAHDSWGALRYEVAGGVKDWMLMGEIGTGTKGKVYGMTGEGGAGGGVGGNNFWAPAAQIVNLCKGMVFQNMQLAYSAGSYVDFQDLDDMAVTDLSGSFRFQLRRIGLGTAPINVSIIGKENILSTGPALTVNAENLPAYYSTHTGSVSYTLPSNLTIGQRISFVWKVETGGYTYYDTVVKYYNPIILFSDDMESGAVTAKWTVTGNWNYSSDLAYEGSRTLAESPGHRYWAGAISGTYTARTASAINTQDATGAYVSFWVRHRAENFCDKLQLQVSTTGPLGPWVALCGNLTVQEPGLLDGSMLNGQPSLTGIRETWTKAVYDITPYKSNLTYLRFDFSSNLLGGTFDTTHQNDEGFNIDNFQVVKSITAPAVMPLPVTFFNISGRLLNDNAVELQWEATIDDMHAYFEVERSGDGIRYVPVGRGNEQPPYQFRDMSPLPGNNFYRIKHYDRDGSYSYSRSINIALKNSRGIVVFPNPVKDQLSIRFVSRTPDLVTVRITDLLGRIHYRKQYSGLPTGDIHLDLSGWNPQVYLLSIVNAQNEVLASQKIIKE